MVVKVPRHNFGPFEVIGPVLGVGKEEVFKTPLANIQAPHVLLSLVRQHSIFIALFREDVLRDLESHDLELSLDFFHSPIKLTLKLMKVDLLPLCDIDVLLGN